MVTSSENISTWQSSFVDDEKWIQCTNNDPTGKTYFLWKSSLSLSYHVNWLWQCVHCPLNTSPADFTKCTVELYLAELTGTASQPNMQKIRKIGFFFENILRWQFEVAIPIHPRTGHWFQEVEASRISRQLSREGGKVVSHKHRPPLP